MNLNGLLIQQKSLEYAIIVMERDAVWLLAQQETFDCAIDVILKDAVSWNFAS